MREAFDGNNLDRAAAANYLNAADAGLAGVKSALTNICEQVQLINEGFPGKDESAVICTICRTFWEAMAEKWSGIFSHIYNINMEMKAQIMTGATTGDVPGFSINLQNFTNNWHPVTSESDGIKDFAATSSAIDTFVSLIANHTASVDDVITQYKNIWSLASGSNYEQLATNANHAANNLRNGTSALAYNMSQWGTQLAQDIHDSEILTGQVSQEAQELISKITDLFALDDDGMLADFGVIGEMDQGLY